MIELIKMLYQISGKNSKRITNMFIFDIIKNIFEGISLGAILLFLKKICENIFNKTPLGMKDVYLIFMVSLLSVVGKILFGYLSDRNKNIAAYSLGAENRLYIGDILKKANLGYFKENSLGKISGEISTTITEVETVGVMIIEQLLVGMIQTFVMMVFVMTFDFMTGIIIFFTLLLGIIVNTLTQNKVDNLTTKLLEIKLSLNSKMIEYVKGISVTKAFSKSKGIIKDLEDNISDAREKFLEVEKIIVPIQFLFSAVFKISTCVIIFSTIFRFLNGSIDITKAIMLIVSSFVVFAGTEMAGSMSNVRGVAIKNISSVIKMRNLPIISEGDKKDIETANIKIENVDFAYKDSNLFEKLNVYIPQGATTALIGFSGSGKTTLCNLMARFWDVNSGKVIIDGSDVKDYRYDSLLSNFSFVFQNIYLFDDTIRNNIKFGNPQASDEEMIEVAKSAQCHDFIMSLPDGYNTVLNEGGSNLSGGEKQRISIARAMLKDSKIVILDEATSSVDPENERELLIALKELLKNKTAVIIAHKISTIKNAEQIIVLKDGKVEQVGNHEKLSREDGIYRKFLDIRQESENWQI